MQQELVEEKVPVQLERGVVWPQAVEVYNMSDIVHFCHKWTISLKMHAAIFCTSLSTITNGRTTYSPDTTSPFNFGTTAIYSCNEGFFLTGESTLTCGGDGSEVDGIWSDSAPVCSGWQSILSKVILFTFNSSCDVPCTCCSWEWCHHILWGLQLFPGIYGDSQLHL